MKTNTMDWMMTEEERELVSNNLKLVKNVIKKRFNRCFDVEHEDLMQLGNLGLIWAAHFYVTRKNELVDCNFATFAWSRIVVYVNRELNTRKDRERLAQMVKNFMGKFYLSAGRHLSLREVGIIFELPEDFIREALNEYSRPENLDDVMEHETDTTPFTDDRLSPLDLAILKEEHLMKAAKLIKDKVDSLLRVIRRLHTEGTEVWDFAPH